MVDHLLVGAPVPVQPESVLFGFSFFSPSRNLSTWIQFCSICFCFWIPRICLVGASFGIQPECGPVFKTEVCGCRVLGLRSRWVLPSGRNLQCSQAGGTASLSFSIYLTLSLSLSLFLSISLSHTHTHSIYLSRSMPACLSACLSLSVARARALSHILTLSLALTHSLTLSQTGQRRSGKAARSKHPRPSRPKAWRRLPRGVGGETSHPSRSLEQSQHI